MFINITSKQLKCLKAWLAEARLLKMCLITTFMSLLLFPFDFARLTLGPYYVPWAVFPILGLALLLALRVITEHKPISYVKPAIYGSALFALGLLLPIALGRPFTPTVLEILFYVSVPLILFNAFARAGNFKAVLYLLIVGGAALAAFGLLRIATGDATCFSFETPRGLGTRNSAAFILEGVYFFALSVFLLPWGAPQPLKILSVPATVLILGAVLLSFSRGTWLSMAFGHLVLVFLIRKHFLRTAIKLGIALLGASLIVWLMYPTAFQHMAARAESTLTLSQEGPASNYSRWVLLVETWNRIKHDPLIGIGAGNFTSEVKVYSRNGTLLAHPHNSYIQVWLENGILGLAGFFLLIGTPLFFLHRRNDSEHNWPLVGAKATMASYTLHLLFASFYNMLFFWAVYGLVLSIVWHSKASGEVKSRLSRASFRVLTIFSEDRVFFDGKSYQVLNPLVIVYGRLLKYFDKIVVSGPTKAVTSETKGYAESGLTFSPRPYYGGSVTGFFRSLHKILFPTLRNIRNNIRKTDLVMIRLPSPIGSLVWREVRRQKKEYFLYLAGDIRKVVSQGEKYRGVLTRACATIVAHAFHRLTEKLARGTLVFVTSSELYKEFKHAAAHCVTLVPSTVSQDDIFERADSCQSTPVKLLYVGRLVPVKGLQYLFEAISLLAQRGLDVELNVVGDGYQQPVLEGIVENLGLNERVHFLGRIPFGPELFAAYRRADVFILPSLSEAIPKALLEAMASGLPIVATRVGGIPDVIKDGENGLLVEPRSPEQIAKAVERLIGDPLLRRKIIRNGYAFVKNHTVEKQAERMWREIRDFFNLEAR